MALECKRLLLACCGTYVSLFICVLSTLFCSGSIVTVAVASQPGTEVSVTCAVSVRSHSCLIGGTGPFPGQIGFDSQAPFYFYDIIWQARLRAGQAQCK
jgi:hypothetical protein